MDLWKKFKSLNKRLKLKNKVKLNVKDGFSVLCEDEAGFSLSVVKIDQKVEIVNYVQKPTLEELSKEFKLGSGLMIYNNKSSVLCQQFDISGLDISKGSNKEKVLEQLKWSFAEKSSFDISNAELEGMECLSADQGGVARPHWWLVAMDQNLLNKRLIQLDKMGFQPSVIDVIPFVLANASFGKNETAAYIFQVDKVIHLIVAKDGHLLFYRSFDWDPLDTFGLSKLGLDIQRGLDFFERRLGSTFAEKVYVSSQAEGLFLSEFASVFGVPLEPLDTSFMDCEKLLSNWNYMNGEFYVVKQKLVLMALLALRIKEQIGE